MPRDVVASPGRFYVFADEHTFVRGRNDGVNRLRAGLGLTRDHVPCFGPEACTGQCMWRKCRAGLVACYPQTSQSATRGTGSRLTSIVLRS